MKIKLSLFVLSILCVSVCQAKQCQIDRMSTTQLRLNSSYQSQAATSFSVSCQSNYAIKFSSRNLMGPSGNSYLVNEKNYKLRTQMNISGASDSRWNIPLSQRAGDNKKFILWVQLIDRPNALTPAGVYKDNLYVSLIF